MSATGTKRPPSLKIHHQEAFSDVQLLKSVYRYQADIRFECS